jgi:hypothetical protein
MKLTNEEISKLIKALEYYESEFGFDKKERELSDKLNSEYEKRRDHIGKI